MSTFTKLPSGRIAYKQNGENSFSIYGSDDTTFITSISFEDIKELKEAADYLEKYETLINSQKIEAGHIDTVEFSDQDADGLVKMAILCKHNVGSKDGEHCSGCGKHLSEL